MVLYNVQHSWKLHTYSYIPIICYWQFSNGPSSSLFSGEQKCLMIDICTKMGPEIQHKYTCKNVWLKTDHSGAPEHDNIILLLTFWMPALLQGEKKKSAGKCSEIFAFSRNEVVHILNRWVLSQNVCVCPAKIYSFWLLIRTTCQLPFMELAGIKSDSTVL